MSSVPCFLDLPKGWSPSTALGLPGLGQDLLGFPLSFPRSPPCSAAGLPALAHPGPIRAPGCRADYVHLIEKLHRNET